MDIRDMASIIDHTLLKPEATSRDIEQLCDEAKTYGFAAVCVNPCWVPLCVRLLKSSQVKVCTVVGFPLGTSTTESKVSEAKQAVMQGAQEVDMVLNVGMLKSGEYQYVENEIKAIVNECRDEAKVKVILETGLLSEEEIRIACRISRDSGAHYVKTSTGFGPRGASTQDIEIMKSEVGQAMGIKASGGIRDRQFAEELVRAGATRIGTSSGRTMIESLRS